MTIPERDHALSAVVRFFQWDLDAAYRALQTHIPNQRGDCAGCGGTNPVVLYPCLVALCAQRAVDLTRPRIPRAPIQDAPQAT